MARLYGRDVAVNATCALRILVPWRVDRRRI
jgi:hypothetical protein